MNKFEPTPEQWKDILQAEPASPEQDEENRKRKEQLESGFDWKGPSVDSETRKATEQEERSERLTGARVESDKNAVQALLEKIRKGF